MMVEFSIIPIGKGESVSEYVAGVLDLVDKSGLEYRLTPMGTVVEGGWDDVMALIKKCHAGVLSGAGRVVTKITIDDRAARPIGRLTQKMESVERRLGRKLKK